MTPILNAYMVWNWDKKNHGVGKGNREDELRFKNSLENIIWKSAMLDI